MASNAWWTRLWCGVALLGESACAGAHDEAGASDFGAAARAPAAPSNNAGPKAEVPPAAPTSEEPSARESASATPMDPPAMMAPAVTPPPKVQNVAPTSDWKLMGYDEGSTYFNRAEVKLTKDNVGKLEMAWQANLGGPLYGAPLQVADRIYVAGPNDLRAFDVSNGNVLWTLEQRSYSSLAYVDGTLYLNATGSKVIAVDASTGALKWQRSADDQPVDGYSSVVGAGSRLFVGGSSSAVELGGGHFLGFMAALDRASGDSLWTTYTLSEPATGAGIFSSPSIDSVGGRVFGTTANNRTQPVGGEEQHA